MLRSDIDKVMAEFPDLGGVGFIYPGDGCAWDDACQDGKDPQKEKDSSRTSLAHSDVELLTKIETRLSKVGKTKAISDRSSYGLKHVIEHMLDEYVSNGEFILVALHCGFRHRMCGPNAWFNMAKRDLDKYLGPSMWRGAKAAS